MTNLLLAALLGVAIGWVGRHVSGMRRRSGEGPRRAQLLRWIEDAPHGWMVVDSSNTVHLLNPRAERYLHRSVLAPLPPGALQAICPEPELAELIHTARLRGRLQRLIWTPRDQELEAIALPGDRGWVAVTLQSRRSLDAQVEQQQRWVCLLYTSPSPRDATLSRMPSSA